MKNLLNNWKTTSAGTLMIGGSIIHLVFQIKAHNANENTWTITLTGILGGLGLLLAGDASASADAKQVETIAKAVDSINQSGTDSTAKATSQTTNTKQP